MVSLSDNQEIVDFLFCGPIRDRPRTLSTLFESLAKWFAENPEPLLDASRPQCLQNTTKDQHSKTGDCAA